MNLLRRLWNYIVPVVDSGISEEIDRKSMRNIYKEPLRLSCAAEFVD